MSADAAVVELARCLAEASDEELVRLAREVTAADGTRRLRAAIDLLRLAARGEETPLKPPDSATLFRVGRLVRRDEVLEALYEAELRGTAPDTGRLDEVGAELAAGAWQEAAALDQAISRVSREWRVERMPVIDRNILRLGLWELRHRPELATGVVISEAVRLAKAYSTERSGPFVNGVLGRLAAEPGSVA